jgi:hypothetical protein
MSSTRITLAVHHTAGGHTTSFGSRDHPSEYVSSVVGVSNSDVFICPSGSLQTLYQYADSNPGISALVVTADQDGTLWLQGATANGANPTWNAVPMRANMPACISAESLPTNVDPSAHATDAGGVPSGAISINETTGVLYKAVFQPASAVNTPTTIKTFRCN